MRINIYLIIENLEQYPINYKSPIQTFYAKEFKKNGNTVEILDRDNKYFIIPIRSILMIEIDQIENEIKYVESH